MNYGTSTITFSVEAALRERDERIKELEHALAVMKNCESCKYYDKTPGMEPCVDCSNLNMWEVRE